MKKTFLKKQEGAAAVEFAIVLPLLLLVVFGIIEFSAILYDKAMITNASREGARSGIVWRPTEPERLSVGEIQAVVNNYLQDHLINFGSSSVPVVTVNGAGNEENQPLTVTINYRYNFLVLPKVAESLGAGLDLSARTIMRME